MTACIRCGSLIPSDLRSDARYCSGYCRNKTSHERRAIYPVTCPWCGKATKFNISDIRRGRKHCSKTCAKRANSAEVLTPELEPEFGAWLAGLTDGEGHFGFRVGAHINVVFTIGMRADDGLVLEMIRDTLGFGKIYTEPRLPHHPLVKFQCVNVRECAAIVEIFNRFPLRSKKSRDFSIWTEAIAAMKTGESNPEILSSIALRLKGARQFR